MDYTQMGDYLFAHIVKKCNLNDDRIVNLNAYLNKRDILNNEVKDFIIEIINNMARYNKEITIDYLIELYLKNGTNENTIRYLKLNSKETIYSFFDENDHFKSALIENFFTCIKNNTYSLRKEEEPKITVEFLPDMLRETYDFIANRMYEDGVEPLFIADIIYNMLTIGGRVITDDEEIIEKFKFLIEYKYVFYRMMFADLYLSCKSNNDDGSFDLIIEHIEKCVEEGKYYLPSNEELAKEFFELYIFLVQDKDARIDTKNKTSLKNREVYNEINPLNIIEDTNIARG